MRQLEEQLMDENEMCWPEVDDIEPDSILEAANDLRVDILDLCINQLDVMIHMTLGLFSFLSQTYSTSSPHLLHPDSYLSHL